MPKHFVTRLLMAFAALLVIAAPARAQLWAARYNGVAGFNDTVNAVAVDKNGDVIVTGVSSNVNTPGLGDRDFVTIKYSGATGAPLWTARYARPGGTFEIPGGVAVSPSGDVFVIGTAAAVGSDLTKTVYVTLKYNGATGAQAWLATYEGPANKHNNTADLAVDASGNVVVTGSSDGPPLFGSDFATIKYNGATGAQMWLARYNGPSGFDIARAVGANTSGDVFVSGTSGNTRGAYDYTTIKYNGTTGAQVWLSRFSGPAGGYELNADLAVDKSGDVIVIGDSDNANGRNDYATIKYDGATGAEVWASRYNGPENGHDVPHAVAVDAHNDVIVTGESEFDPANFKTECATVKYDGATGAQVWAVRERSGRGRSNNVVVDKNNDVVVSADYAGARTLKYDGATGVLTWTMHFPGRGGVSADASHVAVDRNTGDIVIVGQTDVNPNSTYSGEAEYDFLTVKYRANGAPRLAPGFTATDIAQGSGVTVGADGLPDRKLRVLWGKLDTSEAQVWSANVASGGGVFNASLRFGPPGFAALAACVSPASGEAALLWEYRAAGPLQTQAALWTLPVDLSSVTFGGRYGPLYGGWSVMDAQTGGDNKTRVLWRQAATGRLALWRMNAQASAVEASGYIAPPPGYTLFPQIAVSPTDNKTRFAWVKNGDESQIAVWTVGTDLQTVEVKRTYVARNYRLNGVGVGADNKTRLVWARDAAPNVVALWTLPANGANGVVETIKAYRLPDGARLARLRVSPENKFLLLVAPPGQTTPNAPTATVWIVSPDAQTRESVTPFSGS